MTEVNLSDIFKDPEKYGNVGDLKRLLYGEVENDD